MNKLITMFSSRRAKTIFCISLLIVAVALAVMFKTPNDDHLRSVGEVNIKPLATYVESTLAVEVGEDETYYTGSAVVRAQPVFNEEQTRWCYDVEKEDQMVLPEAIQGKMICVKKEEEGILDAHRVGTVEDLLDEERQWAITVREVEDMGEYLEAQLLQVRDRTAD